MIAKTKSGRMTQLSPFVFGGKAMPHYIQRPFHSVHGRSFSLTPFTEKSLAQVSLNFSNNSINQSSSCEDNSRIESECSFEEANFSNEVPLDLNEITLPFPSIKDPAFESVLFKKLKICSQLFSFISDEQIEQREAKTQVLEQFVELFENKSLSIYLNPIQQREIFQMIQINIFRKDPKFPVFSQFSDRPPAYTEPSWLHRSLCYRLLILFIQLFPEAEYVDIIIKKAIIHLQLPDGNERVQLVVFLKKYCDIRTSKRSQILSYLKTAMSFLNECVYNFFCLAPLMNIFSHLVIKCYDTLKNEIKDVFFEGVIPLISYDFLNFSFQHVKNAFLLMIRTDSDLIFITLKKLQKLWPYQNNLKQANFTDLLIAISSSIEHKFFEKYSINFFSFLRDLLYSQQTKLIDTIVGIFLNDCYSSWIASNSAIAIEKLYEPIAILSLTCTDKSLKQKYTSVIQAMVSLNNLEFNKRESIFKNKQKVIEIQKSKNSKEPTNAPKSPNNNLSSSNSVDNLKIIKYGVDNSFFFNHSHDLNKEKKRKDIWLSLANYVSENDSLASKDEQLNRKENIEKFFKREKSDVLAISRFLPQSMNNVEPVKNITMSQRFLLPINRIPNPKKIVMRSSLPRCMVTFI